MSLSFRQLEILEIARAEGRVMVIDLATRFNVAVQTIRRDLTELSDEGKLARVHGGAVFPSGVLNIGYQDRLGLNERAKAQIAHTCAQAIPDGISLFLDIGTSIEAVASELLHHQKLMVVTNNLNVANKLNSNADCEITVTGGALRRSDGGLVGNLATQTIDQFKFDFAVIGCSAVDEDGDLLDFDIQEVGVRKTIIKQTRKVLLVADHSKIQRSAPARIGSLKDVDTLFTDQPLPERLARKCAEWGTQITLPDNV